MKNGNGITGRVRVSIHTSVYDSGRFFESIGFEHVLFDVKGNGNEFIASIESFQHDEYDLMEGIKQWSENNKIGYEILENLPPNGDYLIRGGDILNGST